MLGLNICQSYPTLLAGFAQFHDLLYNAMQRYRVGDMELPDYFIFLDDDTYINIDVFLHHFSSGQEQNKTARRSKS
jgi:hypothetical protein